MNNPGVIEMLDCLDALKNAVVDFAAREEKLNASFHARTSAGQTAWEVESRRLTEKMGEQIDGAEKIFQSATENLQSRFARRKKWIMDAHSAAKTIVGEITAEERGASGKTRRHARNRAAKRSRQNRRRK